MDDFRPWSAPFKISNTVGNNVVDECTGTSNYPIRSEIAMHKFFTESASAYRLTHLNKVNRLIFDETSSKVVMTAVGCLPIFDAQAGEFARFFSALKVCGDIDVLFVSDVWKHSVERRWWAASIDQVVRCHLRRFLDGRIVREGHVRKNCMLRLVLDIDLHGQHTQMV